MLVETPRVDIRPETTEMTVLAGGSAEQQISLVNLTVLPDEFELRVEELPSSWYSFSSDRVNLFPNWSDAVKLKIDIAAKVQPNIYTGRILAVSRTQPNLRAEFPLTIRVLAPLRVDARLDPSHNSGHKADYNLILRNRSQTDSLLTLSLVNNEFCVPHFAKTQVRIPAGKSETVELNVGMRPKTPADQKSLPQDFTIKVQPQWFINQNMVTTPDVEVEGSYTHTSRWAFVTRHPKLVAFLVVLLIILLVFRLLVWLISTILLSAMDGNIHYTTPPVSPLRVEQNSFNAAILQDSPLAVINGQLFAEVEFNELEEWPVTIKLHFFSLPPFTMKGKVVVVNGQLKFVPQDKGQPGSFPWLFMPPTDVVDHINGKLQSWLNSQSNRPSLDCARVEGNTLYINLTSSGASSSGGANNDKCPAQ